MLTFLVANRCFCSQLTPEEIAAQQMAERDAMLAKVLYNPEAIGGASNIPQLEFVSLLRNVFNS
jgi:hypothetical protein